MLLIYSHKLTNRLRYIFTTLFVDILNVPIEFTCDVEYFKKSNSPKINYSNHKITDELFFQSSALLYEIGIKEQNINVFENNGNKCFYKVGKDSCLPFDPFAASFYLISRYEEYLPHIRDEHDRFTSSESIAFQHQFLTTPLVNIWANEIASIISKEFPEFKCPNQHFKYISTIDVDNAYSYKNKGLIRTIGGFIKSLKEGDFKNRIHVLFKGKKDPYDTFKYQFQLHKKHNIKPLYFFLLGDYSLNDKNTPVKNKEFQSLIKGIADYYDIGIHPSYASNSDIKILIKEIKRLQEITHKSITISRQHFLKLHLPETYQNLIDNDITADYTMGYVDKSGFRASICSPFYFYNLDTESTTKLKIHPFAVMEATYMYYEKCTPEKTIQQITKLMQAVKEVNGTFISVWHNESFSEEGIWKGWKIVYEKMLKVALNS
ncbi:MAG: polysaccharide deacetylase family protein [Vicingus serpentipes]|nr:polysaccharide deacetylase family protein [Vicingus serpentipes]